jgi:hypothetical protein
MKRVCWAMLILFAVIAHSTGHERGNGIEAIVCRNTTGVIESAELFDFHEARELRAVEQDLGADSLSVKEKVELVIQRLQPISPKRYERYRKDAALFMRENGFVNAMAISPNQDPRGNNLQPGCGVERIADRVESSPLLPSHYYINEEVWNHFDNNSKAGLILHQVIFKEALTFGVQNSLGTRYLNSRLTSKDNGFDNLLTFAVALAKAGFGKAEYQGINFLPEANSASNSPMRFWDPNRLQKAFVADQDTFRWAEVQIVPLAEARVSFDRGGNLVDLQVLNKTHRFMIVQENVGEGRPAQKIAAIAARWNTGIRQIESVWYVEEMAVTVGERTLRLAGIGGSVVDLDHSMQATFYPGLRLKDGVLATAVELVHRDGATKLCQPGPIHFDEDQKVIFCRH